MAKLRLQQIVYTVTYDYYVRLDWREKPFNYFDMAKSEKSKKQQKEWKENKGSLSLSLCLLSFIWRMPLSTKHMEQQ